MKYTMKEKVRTLRKNESLLNVLKDIITEHEGLFSTIRFEKAFVEMEDLLEVKAKNNIHGIYSLHLEGYKIQIDFGEPKDNWNWFVIWEVQSPEEEILYNNCFYLEDFLKGITQGVNIWVRKWGSKTKIGEF